jgi:hypothetical protein
MDGLVLTLLLASAGGLLVLATIAVFSIMLADVLKNDNSSPSKER